MSRRRRSREALAVAAAAVVAVPGPPKVCQIIVFYGSWPIILPTFGGFRGLGDLGV